MMVSDLLNSKTAFHFGFGGGLKILLWSRDNANPGALREILMDIKVNYLKSGKAESLDMNSIHYHVASASKETSVDYEITEPNTSNYQFRFGISIVL